MSNHHIDLLLATEPHDLLAESDEKVLSDIVEAAEFKIIESTDGPKPRYNLDIIVTDEGMETIENLSEGEGDLATLCSSLAEEAEETEDTVLVGRMDPKGDTSRQLQAWQRGFDPMDEIEGTGAPDGNPIGEMVKEMRSDNPFDA